jgi:hypothetical protein
MAQKVSVLVLDDLTGAEGAEMVRFALDGQDLEIDLVPENAASLRGTLEQYIPHARRISPGKSPAVLRRALTAPPRASQPVVANGVNIKPANGYQPTTEEVREWAKARGIPVKDRGRLAVTLVDAFKLANPIPRA